jgi:YggT family protein
MAQLLRLVAALVSVEILLILVWVVMSWFRVDPTNPVRRALDVLVLPLLRPIRRMMPVVAGLDLSPLVLIIGLQISVQLLYGLANVGGATH